MKLNSSNENKVRYEIFNLMEEVQFTLKEGVRIDDFLDETDIFNALEDIISEIKYTVL
tara:strand:+ start:1212 stop:1385 length:174 start_codon:yes stop_codon:yes gene_type:complete